MFLVLIHLVLVILVRQIKLKNKQKNIVLAIFF